MKIKLENDLQRRVLRGCKWIDKIDPLWARKINIDAFDIKAGDACILGSVFGDLNKDQYATGYSYAIQNLLDNSYDLARERGFDYPDVNSGGMWDEDKHPNNPPVNEVWSQLQEMWLYQIRRRLPSPLDF